MKKKLVLLLLVFTEIAMGSFFLFRYYQKIMEERNVLGVHDVATINKSDVQLSQNDNLKYFWTYEPNTVVVDERDWLPYKKATYIINTDGMNDSNNYEIEKPQNTFRIITLGDSHTFGHYVNTEDNWTEVLEKKMKDIDLFCEKENIEIINLGMPGYDLNYTIEFYKNFGQKYDPDLILWFESGSGFNRFNEELQPQIEECRKDVKATDEAALKKEYTECWNKNEKKFEAEHPLEARVEMMEHQYDRYYKLENNNKTIVLFYENISKDKREVIETWRTKYSPILFVPIISMPSRDKYLPDGHPGPSGHQEIADTIFNFLINNEVGCK